MDQTVSEEEMTRPTFEDDDYSDDEARIRETMERHNISRNEAIRINDAVDEMEAEKARRREAQSNAD